jgi:hypothetical protein
VFSWCFDPLYDILWSFDADKVRVIAYSNSPTIEQQNAEPAFFRRERQMLQCTELFVPVDTELRFSDTQMRHVKIKFAKFSQRLQKMS